MCDSPVPAGFPALTYILCESITASRLTIPFCQCLSSPKSVSTNTYLAPTLCWHKGQRPQLCVGTQLLEIVVRKGEGMAGRRETDTMWYPPEGAGLTGPPLSCHGELWGRAALRVHPHPAGRALVGIHPHAASAHSPRTVSQLCPVSKPPRQRARGLTGLSISLQALAVQPLKNEQEIPDAER